jgi:MFS transporter, DHA1 family, inner membrane transport protein
MMPEIPADIRMQPARHARAAELALAVGGFAIGTGEFASMGLLPNVATGLNVSIPTAGYIISAYALGVVVGAPLLAVLGARMSRRALVVALMVFFALGNLASTLAPTHHWLVLLRFLSGLPHGAYFGTASLIAVSMAGPNGRAQAVGRVMMGLTVATLLGMPLATWVGQTLGWRSLFAIVAIIGALAVALIAMFVPADEPDAKASALRELGALRKAQLWLTLGIGAVGFGGMFAVFSYITPTLVDVGGLSQQTVPFALMVFGAGMILGMMVGGRLADRALMPTIFGVLVWNVAVMLLFYLTASHGWIAVFDVFLVGTGSALVAPLQTRLMDVAAEAQTLPAALNHSAFNVANALGAWLGGVTIDAGLGWTSTCWVGALLAGGGLVFFAASRATDTARQAAA